MTDQELKDLVAGLAISQAKTDEQLILLKESQAKTDEQLKASRIDIDKQLKSLKESQAKTDEQLNRTDEQLKTSKKELSVPFKTVDEILDRVDEQLGGISNNQGDVAEEYFVNSLGESLAVAGMHFDTLLKNVGMQQKGIRDEFDILLVNGESVALIEVKYKVHPNILDRLPQKIAHLKQMPQYKNYKVYAGIAGFYIPDSVIEEASKRGYFVLQRKGDIIETYADDLRVA